jgi:ribosomal protein S3
MNQQIREIAIKIGRFYLMRSNNDYEVARFKLLNLMITNIDIDDTVRVVITTGRPGLLIGPKGKWIDELINYLGVPIKIVESNNNLYDWLIPYPE